LLPLVRSLPCSTPRRDLADWLHESGFLFFQSGKRDNGILEVKYKLPHADSNHPELAEGLMAAREALEHSHSLTDQLGGQMKASIHIFGLHEDYHGTSAVSKYTPTYTATRAIKH